MANSEVIINRPDSFKTPTNDVGEIVVVKNGEAVVDPTTYVRASNQMTATGSLSEVTVSQPENYYSVDLNQPYGQLGQQRMSGQIYFKGLSDDSGISTTANRPYYYDVANTIWKPLLFDSLDNYNQQRGLLAMPVRDATGAINTSGTGDVMLARGLMWIPGNNTSVTMGKKVYYVQRSPGGFFSLDLPPSGDVGGVVFRCMGYCLFAYTTRYGWGAQSNGWLLYFDPSPNFYTNP